MTQMTINEKLEKILEIINLMEVEDEPGVSTIFLDGFILSMNIIKEMSERTEPIESVDISKQIEMVTSILGVSLQDLVMQIIKDMNENQEMPDKEVDKNTLDFITSTADLDDYDKFLAQNKAKEDLDFLSKAI
jgi:hypothetical protein